MTTTMTKAPSTYAEFKTCEIDGDFTRPANKPANEYPNLTQYRCEDGETAFWSGRESVPAIGARMTVNFNQWDAGTVMGYFREGGWLGLLVQVDAAPHWWTERNKGKKLGYVHVFGSEVATGGAK